VLGHLINRRTFVNFVDIIMQASIKQVAHDDAVAAALVHFFINIYVMYNLSSYWCFSEVIGFSQTRYKI
jgi:hydrogenase-4 membrane subunit HyfE